MLRQIAVRHVKPRVSEEGWRRLRRLSPGAASRDAEAKVREARQRTKAAELHAEQAERRARAVEAWAKATQESTPSDTTLQTTTDSAAQTGTSLLGSDASSAVEPMAADNSGDLSKPRIARWEVVQGLLDFYDAPRYLEVGVHKGDTFHHLKAEFRVAVDPEFRFDWESEQVQRGDRAQYHQVTSDEYFGSIAGPDQLFDVIYLDGLHTFEQTLRDLNNALVHLAPRGVILIDDVKPTSYHASLPNLANFSELRSYVKDKGPWWMGDVYRLVWMIDSFYQSLSYATVANNHGQAVVWRERRRSVTERTVAEIGDLSFESFVLDQATLHSRPFGEIVKDLKGKIGR